MHALLNMARAGVGRGLDREGIEGAGLKWKMWITISYYQLGLPKFDYIVPRCKVLITTILGLKEESANKANGAWATCHVVVGQLALLDRECLDPGRNSFQVLGEARNWPRTNRKLWGNGSFTFNFRRADRIIECGLLNVWGYKVWWWLGHCGDFADTFLPACFLYFGWENTERS